MSLIKPAVEESATGPEREATRHNWATMSFYERFEQVVALILSAVIMIVVIVAMFQLIRTVFVLLLSESLDPLKYEVFQAIFGMIMTLLIAMEFKHSIIRVAMRHESIIQVKTVVLIAMIALARKFVILDVDATPGKIAALAGALLALGLVYWLLRERDDCEMARQRVARADQH